MRTLLELGCEIGWRRNVWLNLRVKDVDMLHCRITLPGGTVQEQKALCRLLHTGREPVPPLECLHRRQAPGRLRSHTFKRQANSRLPRDVVEDHQGGGHRAQDRQDW